MNFSFLSKILLSQKGTLIYSGKKSVLKCLKRINPEENLDLFKQLFLSNAFLLF